MKRDLRGMISKKLILDAPPPPPISKFIVYLLMIPTFSIFTLAIKFDCLFLAIFQSFHLFMSCIFDKFAPPPPPGIYMFKKMF